MLGSTVLGGLAEAIKLLQQLIDDKPLDVPNEFKHKNPASYQQPMYQQTVYQAPPVYQPPVYQAPPVYQPQYQQPAQQAEASSPFYSTDH